MRLGTIVHAIGKTAAVVNRVMGDYLKTIEERLEMFFSPPFSEYAPVEVRRHRREARQ